MAPAHIIPLPMVQAVIRARHRYGIRTFCALSGIRLSRQARPRIDSLPEFLWPAAYRPYAS